MYFKESSYFCVLMNDAELFCPVVDYKRNQFYIFVCIVFHGMPLTYFDETNIAGAYSCFGTVIVYECAFAFDDGIRFCVAYMLMPSNRSAFVCLRISKMAAAVVSA